MKILIIIDMQNDFCSPNGSLANPAAEAIIPAIKERISLARQNNEMVIFTMDTHYEDYLDTLEGEKLPVEHCIYQTDGWEIVDELAEEAALCVMKPTFGSFDLIGRVQTLSQAFGGDIEIEVCGTVSSICVLANCILLRAAMPNTKIVVNENLIADITPEGQAAAITCLKAQQIDVIKS